MINTISTLTTRKDNINDGETRSKIIVNKALRGISEKTSFIVIRFS